MGEKRGGERLSVLNGVQLDSRVIKDYDFFLITLLSYTPIFTYLHLSIIFYIIFSYHTFLYVLIYRHIHVSIYLECV